MFFDVLFFILFQDLSMAASNQSRFNKEPRDNESLTQLIKILDEEQPYNKFSSFSDPKLGTENNEKIKKVQGSLIGLAVGDALGASVEFRPNAYLKATSSERYAKRWYMGSRIRPMDG